MEERRDVSRACERLISKKRSTSCRLIEVNDFFGFGDANGSSMIDYCGLSHLIHGSV